MRAQSGSRRPRVRVIGRGRRPASNADVGGGIGPGRRGVGPSSAEHPPLAPSPASSTPCRVHGASWCVSEREEDERGEQRAKADEGRTGRAVRPRREDEHDALRHNVVGHLIGGVAPASVMDGKRPQRAPWHAAAKRPRLRPPRIVQPRPLASPINPAMPRVFPVHAARHRCRERGRRHGSPPQHEAFCLVCPPPRAFRRRPAAQQLSAYLVLRGLERG